MKILRTIPAVLSLLMLAAHFFRAGNLPIVALYALLIVVAFIPKNLAIRIVQFALMIGALVWPWTLLQIIGERQAQERPFKAAVIIMLSVELFTVASAVLLQWNLRPRIANDGAS